jgi:hypothetical protein
MHGKITSRYVVTIRNNKVAEIDRLDDEDEEMLGIEWALSELKDSNRHNGSVDGSYTLAGEEELSEFLDQVRALLGADAVAGFEEAPDPD